MNKVIIIFGLMLILIAGVAFYQFSKTQQSQVKTSGKVTIAAHTFDVEVVRDSKDQQIGLTKYNSMGESQGMLFIFEQPGNYGFWMRNMKFPLDIIFIRNDTVVSLHQEVQPVEQDADNPPVYRSEVPADKVLEIQSGLAEKYNIKTGDKVKFEL